MFQRAGLLFIILALGALGGCAGNSLDQYLGMRSSYTPPPPEAGGPYQLDSGDRLRVTVFGQENLTSTYIVDGSGAISMPLIGSVPARGRTTAQLEQSIAARLREGYLRQPDVSVQVETHRPFFILGEVRNPGQYPYVNGMTVETAVAIAGGYTPRAAEGRATLTRTAGGRVTQARVPASHPLRPGDTVKVAERFF